MDERKDIYQQPDKPPGEENLPAYERTPDEMRAEVRRKAIGFGLLILAFAVFAAIMAWNESKKNTEKSDLRDQLNSPLQPAGPVARMTPPPELVEQAAPHDIFTNIAPAAEMTPQKMADAMTEIRAANQYITVRDWDNADRHLTNALAVWPEMNLALRLRGLVFTQRGQFDEAIILLERALKKDPFNSEAYNTLATAYIQKKQFEHAEDLLQTALTIRPDYAATKVNLGLLYMLMRKYDLAVEQLQDAEPKMPDNAAVLNNIGVCFMRMNRFDDARKKLQELVGRDPKRAAPYFNIAMTYSLQNDSSNAVEWIRKGAAQCTPADVQRFLTDQDFDMLRAKPEYQALLRELYPQLPRGPGT